MRLSNICKYILKNRFLHTPLAATAIIIFLSLVSVVTD